MKNSISRYVFIWITSMLAFISIPINQISGQQDKKTVKIGVYDSRIIVMAYSRSDFFIEHQRKLALQSDSTVKTKDTLKMKEFANKAISYQHLLHQMVFSSGSAKDIVMLIMDKLPELAKQEGLVLIVSKFEINYMDPSVEIVDLTKQLVKLFNPKQNIDKMCDEIEKIDPIPIEELTIGLEMLDGFCDRFRQK
jgi:hypothetical protein